MVERKRTKALNVRMTDDELVMLDDLAHREGLSISDWIRHTIRTSHRKAFDTDARPSKRKRK